MQNTANQTRRRKTASEVLNGFGINRNIGKNLMMRLATAISYRNGRPIAPSLVVNNNNTQRARRINFMNKRNREFAHTLVGFHLPNKTTDLTTENLKKLTKNINAEIEKLKKLAEQKRSGSPNKPIILHPATQKLVNTVTNYSSLNAQTEAARALANRYSKMYPLGNNNEKRLIKRFFFNKITNQQRINAAQRNINKIVPSRLMTTRKNRFATFLNILKRQTQR
jgi:hypothetical protein